MSKESFQWLNTRTLIGFTDKRGKAWHYRESEQGVEPNHYPGPIPVEDVLRRLFNWKAVERPIFVYDDDFVEVPNRKAIVADDNGDVLGVFKDGYQPHQYEEWLIDNVANLLDADLGIGSAALLRNRGVAFVQVEVPDNFMTKDGVVFRPNIGAATSFDGSLSSTIKRGFTNWVCDNSMWWGLSEDGEQVKIKHTRGSSLRITEAREALNLIFNSVDEISKELEMLCATNVSQQQFHQVLDTMIPMPVEDGRSKTVAEKKRSQIETLWFSDPRVAPWANTAWGVAQAFNTWQQHFSRIKGDTHRAERNIDNGLSGKTGTQDQAVLTALSAILEKELVAS